MTNFDQFGLSPKLNQSLQDMFYKEPTPIQLAAIPLALKGHDILGSAQTGTGKTAAFSIPLVEALHRNPQGCALVLTPTRELAKQVLDVIHQLLGRNSNINTAFLIGGEAMGKQLNSLRQNPRIIVGTPGRINDHLERGLRLDRTNFLVLDETDRMLDMGFGVQLERINKHLPQERQTLMFSATMPKGIVALSAKYLTNPERVSMGNTNVVALNIKQEILHIDQDKKYEELVTQLTVREGTVIIFSKTKYGSEKMAKRLCNDGFEADALHGDLKQSKRTAVLNSFRKQKFRILVATDVAARGLDVPHIAHVINFDLPQVPEDYIHRMGRTARAGAEGSALCFISPADRMKWRAIEALLDPSKASNDDDYRPGKKSSRKKPFEKRGRSDKPRGASSFRDKKPREEKSWNDKPREAREDRPQRSDKPRSERKWGDTPRDDKPEYIKPRSTKPFGDKPRGEKTYGDKPRSGKPFEKKTYGEKKSYGDKPRGERTYGDKPRSDKPFEKKTYGEKKSYGDKPRGERTYGDKPRGDKPFEKKSYGEKKPYGDKPRGERTYGDKPRSDKPFEKKTYGEKKSYGDKPRGERTYGDKPRSDKPFEKKTYGDKPRSDKPRSDRPFSDKPRSGKPAGNKSGEGKKTQGGAGPMRRSLPAKGKSSVGRAMPTRSRTAATR